MKHWHSCNTLIISIRSSSSSLAMKVHNNWTVLMNKLCFQQTSIAIINKTIKWAVDRQGRRQRKWMTPQNCWNSTSSWMIGRLHHKKEGWRVKDTSNAQCSVLYPLFVVVLAFCMILNSAEQYPFSLYFHCVSINCMFVVYFSCLIAAPLHLLLRSSFPRSILVSVSGWWVREQQGVQDICISTSSHFLS